MINNFYFTQTAIKDFERDTTCPYRWKKQWVDKEFTLASSEDQDKGKYFEWLFIGAGAIQGDDVTDLPRLKNGDKSTDQLRIEAQANRAKDLFKEGTPEYLGLNIKDVQVELKSSSGRKGTLDIVAIDPKTGEIWVIDVKLTRDLTNNRSEYGWGNDWTDLDLLQQLHYESLFEEVFGQKPRMALLVFDYSPQKRVEFGEIVISDKKRVDKNIRFSAAEETFNLYEKHGWIKLPSVKECENCPLKCDSRLLGNKLIRKKINY